MQGIKEKWLDKTVQFKVENKTGGESSVSVHIYVYVGKLGPSLQRGGQRRWRGEAESKEQGQAIKVKTTVLPGITWDEDSE